MCQREDANSILGHVHTFGTCKSRSTWQIVGVRSYTALACIHGHSALISAVAAWTPKPHSWPLCPLADHAASLHCALPKFHFGPMQRGESPGKPSQWDLPRDLGSTPLRILRHGLQQECTSIPALATKPVCHELREFPKMIKGIHETVLKHHENLQSCY